MIHLQLNLAQSATVIRALEFLMEGQYEVSAELQGNPDMKALIEERIAHTRQVLELVKNAKVENPAP